MAINRTLKKEVDVKFERKAQLPKTLPNMPSYVFRGALTPFLSDAKDLANLSNSCVFFHLNSKTELNKRVLQTLLQAVIDDDKQTVTNILSHATPERLNYLLTTDPTQVGIQEIESKKTWLRIKPQPVFITAQRMNFPAMTSHLFPYFDKQPELKLTRCQQWVKSDPLTAAEQKIMQDHYVEKYFLPLIVTLSGDNTIQVLMERNNETGLYKEGRVLNPSPETQLALDDFRKKVLPEQTIDLDRLDTPKSLGQLDNYVNIEQLFIAAYRAYETHFNTFQNWDQRYAYSICVIGFIIPLFGPEDGKKFCKGLYYIVNNIEPDQPNPNASSLQLADGHSFYRSSRISLHGAGFNFLCDTFAGVGSVGACGTVNGFADELENYVKQKQQSFANLSNESIAPQGQVQKNSNPGA